MRINKVELFNGAFDPDNLVGVKMGRKAMMGTGYWHDSEKG
jgi:hypothetical protein